MVEERQQRRAHDPPHRIREGDRQNARVEQLGNIKEDLPERHKAAQHHDRGQGGAADAAQRAGIDLVEAAEAVERYLPVEEQFAELHDFRLGIEEGDNGTGKEQDERRAWRV